MEMLVRRMKADAITVHGFRSSFRDWCGEETDLPRELAEAALAHASATLSRGPTVVAIASQKRRELMDGWADYAGSADR